MRYVNLYVIILTFFILALPNKVEAEVFETKHVSCRFSENGLLSSCFHILHPTREQKNELTEACRAGDIEQSLCPLDNSLGQCVVSNAEETRTFIHYKLGSIPDQLLMVKKNCLHNKGQWKALDPDVELLNEMKKAYIKRFDKKPPTKEQIKQVESFAQQIKVVVIDLIQRYLDFSRRIFEPSVYYHPPQKGVPQNEEENTNEWKILQKAFRNFRSQHPELSKSKALEDPNWYLPYEVAAEREIWSRLEPGGCGTLSTLLCGKQLGTEGLNLQKIDAAYQHKPGTTYLGHAKFFRERGLFVLPEKEIIEGKSCQSYKVMKSWIDLGCSLELNMSDGKVGHAEYIYDVYYSEALNFCYGLTNTWGTPNIFSGGSGDFVHGKFDKYNHTYSVYFGAFCPPNTRVFERFMGIADGLLRTDNWRGHEWYDALEIYSQLAEKNYKTEELEKVASAFFLKEPKYAFSALQVFRSLFKNGKGFDSALKLAEHVSDRYDKIAIYSALFEFNGMDRSKAEDVLDDANCQSGLELGLIRLLVSSEKDSTKFGRYFKIAKKCFDSKRYLDEALEVFSALMDKGYPINIIIEALSSHAHYSDFEIKAVYEFVLKILRDHIYSANDRNLLQIAWNVFDPKSNPTYLRPREKKEYMERKVQGIDLFRTMLVHQSSPCDKDFLEVFELAKNIQSEEVQIQAWGLLTDLVKKNDPEAIRYAREQVKEWKEKKNTYIQEIKELLH